MTAIGRIIPLRRPVVIHREPTPFVPAGDEDTISLDEIDVRWRALCAANPAYFDGGLYHVIGVHRNGCGGAAMHVCDSSYRFFAVQDESLDLGVRPLGVKGISMMGGRVLMGRRSASVAAYQGQWEFAPGGVVEPGVEPEMIIRRELTEETGIELPDQAMPRQIAVIFDPVIRCWELICRMDLAGDAAMTPNAEYTDLDWFDVDALPERLSPVSRQMASLL